MSLMKLIQQYDYEVEEERRELLKQNAELKARDTKRVNDLVSGVAVSERMKLDLILNGCLSKPKTGAEARVDSVDVNDINLYLLDRGCSEDAARDMAKGISEMLNGNERVPQAPLAEQLLSEVKEIGVSNLIETIDYVISKIKAEGAVARDEPHLERMWTIGYILRGVRKATGT